jgi:hypothetical protein
MANEISETRETKTFICCFEFSPDEDLVDSGNDGTFEIVVEARDADDAAARCRPVIREMVKHREAEIVVYASVFIEVSGSDLKRGILVNHQEFGVGRVICSLPEQGDTSSKEHFVHQADEETPAKEEEEIASSDADSAGRDAATDGDDDDDREEPVFWAKWKLYWCETEDHDEDWFVVARSVNEAETYHVNAEGYDNDDASAEFICVLPDSAQIAVTEGPAWPSEETLLACGAEYIPYVPNDGLHGLRTRVASGARAVRINGRVYTEGDVVGNIAHEVAGTPKN